MHRFAAALSLALMLAACARSEDASAPAVTERPGRDAAPAPDPQENELEMAIGEWRESLQDDFAALEFGPAGAPPLFSFRCDERGGLLLQRHGTSALGDLPYMLMSIDSETRRLPVTTAGGTIPMLRATLAPRDPLLTHLRTPGAITIRIGDAVPLVLPPSPMIGTLVAACLSGEGRPERPAAETEGAAEANLVEPTANSAR